MIDRDTVNIVIDGKIVAAGIGHTLGEYISIDLPCGGHGKCGKCKVRVEGEVSEPSESERKRLTDDEINEGIRLACRAVILGECRVETLGKERVSEENIANKGSIELSSVSPAFEKYGVSLDIGTTTLAARLYDTKGNLLAKSVRLNSQARYGADIVSRIEAATYGNAESLCRCIVKDIDEMLCEMADSARLITNDVDGVVVTGNTAMLQLFTNTSIENLARAPFALVRKFNEDILAKDLELNSLCPETKVFLPACISAFVGADTVCAIIASDFCSEEKTKLLVDIGTNGEICLWQNGELYVTSTAAGPAFEGVGISCGMRADVGAVDKVFVKDGKAVAHVIGDASAKGICGSGLVDAISALREIGLLDEMGKMTSDSVEIAEGVCITQNDIQTFQIAKAAICGGIRTLMDTANIEKTDTTAIAGGFGSCLIATNAERIGLIPSGTAKDLSVLGNAALDGASRLLLDKGLRTKCADIAERAIVVELAANPTFFDNYVEAMMF